MPDSISVVIPSYNHADFIGTAIESVLNQSRAPDELIVIDDGSQDGSPERIEAFRPLFDAKKIKLVTHYRANRGAHETLNEGIEMARSEWVSILNSDDYYETSRLAELLSAAKRKKSELAISWVEHVDAQGKALPDSHAFRHWYVQEINRARKSVGFSFLFHNIGVTTGNLFMTKRLWKKVGGFRPYTLIHDYDFFLRSMDYTSIALVEKNLISYRIHGSNTIQQQSHLEMLEGAEMAAEFFRDVLLRKERPHQDAPWSNKNKQAFAEFWKDGNGSVVKHWLGGVDLSDCF